MLKNEITNPKLKAQTFKARFLEAGVVQYDNEMVLIKPENLMTIAMDFKGAHTIIDHQDVAENEANEKIVGYINNVWFEDGWAWCDFTVNNEEAITLINQGYSVSCAYYPKYAEGGSYHNILYEREIVGGEAIHLAIVKTPRYEGAIILKNSINNIMTIFKFKKDKKENKAEVKEIQLENAMFEIEGEDVPVSVMVEAFKNEKKNEKEKEKKVKVNADDEVEVEGEMVKVSELASVYKSSKKKNAEEEEEEKENSEDEDKKEKENAEEEEEEKKEAKKNSLQNASNAFQNGSEKPLTNTKELHTERRAFELANIVFGKPQPINQ